MSRKNDLFEYLEKFGQQSFEENAFNEVDGLIFSILSYINYDRTEPGMKLSEIPEAVFLLEKEGDFGPLPIAKSVRKLLKCVAESERFCNVSIRRYICIMDEERQMQFGAVSFILPDGTVIVSYRGTDESLIGWKEDLNMSFLDGIPSQFEAVKFARVSIEENNSPAIIVGHSKGGNLAIYAAVNLSANNRALVRKVYANDAPGFDDDFFEAEAYREIKPRITTYVPQSSIVGIIFAHDDFVTIHSTSPTVLQHDPFSWSIGEDKFITAERRTFSGKKFDYVVNTWISSMTKEEREEVVEYIWTIVSSSNAKTLMDLVDINFPAMKSMKNAFVGIEFEEQKRVFVALNKIVFETIKGKINRRREETEAIETEENTE